MDGRGPDSEFAGLSAAMMEMLTRLTGDSKLAESKKLDSLMNDPQKYITQYGFKTAPSGAMTLKAQFDQRALESALKLSGVKHSTQALPALLVWLAAAGQGKSNWHFIGADDSAGFGAALKTAAARRRLPLILPMLDLEDETHITPVDAIEGHVERITSASARYKTQAMLSGAVESLHDGGPYEARLNLILANGQSIPWTQQGEQPDKLMQLAVNWAAEYLAKNRLPERPEQSILTIVVEDVVTLDNYLRALRHLRAQEQVASVTVKSLESSRVAFAVKPSTSAERLTQALAEGGMDFAPVGTDGLTYRLMP